MFASSAKWTEFTSGCLSFWRTLLLWFKVGQNKVKLCWYWISPFVRFASVDAFLQLLYVSCTVLVTYICCQTQNVYMVFFFYCALCGFSFTAYMRTSLFSLCFVWNFVYDTSCMYSYNWMKSQNHICCFVHTLLISPA